MSYRKNSVISYLLKMVEKKFQSETGIEPKVDSVPWADWDFAYDFRDRTEPKLYLYSGLGSWDTLDKPDPRIIRVLDKYLPETIKLFQKGN